MKTKKQNKASLSLTGIATMLLMMLIIASCGNNSSKQDKLTSFSEPQQYSSGIEIDSSKNVVLTLTLSADAKQITEIKLSAEKLYLTPENVSKKQNDAKGTVEFAYLERSAMQTIMAIETNQDGYNVVATDESGRPILDHLEFTGGFASGNAVEIKDGKLQIAEIPFICDLTITNSRIYGTIKIEISGGGTKNIDVELKNVTKGE
jgi:hypothetical protein